MERAAYLAGWTEPLRRAPDIRMLSSAMSKRLDHSVERTRASPFGSVCMCGLAGLSGGWLPPVTLGIRPHENFVRIRHLLFAPSRNVQPYWLCNRWTHGALDQRLG